MATFVYFDNVTTIHWKRQSILLLLRLCFSVMSQ